MSIISSLSRVNRALVKFLKPVSAGKGSDVNDNSQGFQRYVPPKADAKPDREPQGQPDDPGQARAAISQKKSGQEDKQKGKKDGMPDELPADESIAEGSPDQAPEAGRRPGLTSVSHAFLQIFKMSATARDRAKPKNAGDAYQKALKGRTQGTRLRKGTILDEQGD